MVAEAEKAECEARGRKEGQVTRDETTSAITHIGATSLIISVGGRRERQESRILGSSRAGVPAEEPDKAEQLKARGERKAKVQQTR